MRETVYLTQNEIDNIVQKMKPFECNYNIFRAFQDGNVNRVTTAYKIYVRQNENNHQSGSI